MVRNVEVGDRVVIPSTIACGACAYCRAGYYSQCDEANPNGKRAGTSFFGGPEATGSSDGLQAEKARIPFAHVGLVKLPDAVSDEQAILISDIFPTGWFGAEIAEVGEGDTVAVFGAGPVGQFAIASAKMMGAGRVFAVDRREDRLAMARKQGAECVNFETEDPVETLVALTGGIGVDRVIDAVGVDAEHAHHGDAAPDGEEAERFAAQKDRVAPEQNPQGENWHPGDAPGQALEWAVQALAKAGTLGIVGVYPPHVSTFPIGQAMNKNLTLKMGNCPHRRYVPMLVDMVRTGACDPTAILTQTEEIGDAVEAFRRFDQRQSGWIKVEVLPA